MTSSGSVWGKFLLTGLLLALIWIPTLSQTLPAASVTSDLIFLKEQILKYNPGVERYNPRFAAQADSLISRVTSDCDRYVSYTYMSRLCALANEGHFELGSWEDAVHTGILNDIEPFLPFSVIIAENNVYVDGDFTDNAAFERGDRILSINGRMIGDILRTLLDCTPTDGHITTYGMRKIESNFPWYYHFYVEQASEFEIEFEPARKTGPQRITVKALTNTQRKENAYKKKPKQPAKESTMDDFYTLSFTDDYALFTLKSFDFRLVDKFNIKAKDFYSEVFTEIKESYPKNLVIDIRGNTGGRNAFGEGIVPFIMQDETDAPFLKQNISWSGKRTTDKVPKPHKNRFEGNIYVLIDGYTFSNGGVIARYLKEFGNARFYGEEGGMRYEGFVAGSKEYVTLPNAQIRIGIPRYDKVFPPSTKQTTTNRGLLPDVTITRSIQDRLDDKDPVLEAVLADIRG